MPDDVDRLLAAECVKDIDRVRARARQELSGFDALVLTGVLTAWRADAEQVIAVSRRPGGPDAVLPAGLAELSQIAGRVDDVLASLAEWADPGSLG